MIPLIELNKANPQIPESFYIKQYNVIKADKCDDVECMLLEVDNGKYYVGIASVTIKHFKPVNLWKYYDDFMIGELIRLRLRPNNTYSIVKIIAMERGVSRNEVDEMIKNDLKLLNNLSWEKLYYDHINAWRNVWNSFDLRIDGDKYMEDLLKFNAFHLLQLVNEDLNEIKVFTKKPEDIINDVLKVLMLNNIEIHRLRLEEPTLEDVFIYFAKGS